MSPEHQVRRIDIRPGQRPDMTVQNHAGSGEWKKAGAQARAGRLTWVSLWSGGARAVLDVDPPRARPGLARSPGRVIVSQSRRPTDDPSLCPRPRAPSGTPT